MVIVKESRSQLLYPPTAEQSRLVRKQVNNTYATKRAEYVDQLKEWMHTQPHLPRNYDERVLPKFVTGTKYNLHRAQRKIDNYFTARTKVPEFFAQRDPASPEIQQAWNAITVLPLPRTRGDGARVTLHIPNEVDTSEHVVQHVYRMIFMISDIRMVEEHEISGDVFVFDLRHVGVTITLKHAGSLLKKALGLAQTAYPQRLKEIHIINAHPIVNRGINLFRSFMKEKMRNRFVVHSSPESLHQYVPADVLPAEYGGCCRTVASLRDQWGKALESYALYFQQQEGVKANLQALQALQAGQHAQQANNKQASSKTAAGKQPPTAQTAFRTLSID